MPQGTLLRCEHPVSHTGLRTTGHPGQSVGIMWGRGEKVAERELLRAAQHSSLQAGVFPSGFCRCCGQGSGR